jgi:hypothetical protein
MANFKHGDRVRIVAGKYQRNGHGTYLGIYGKVMCNVKIDGDTVQQRHLWLTSIRHVPAEKSSVDTDASQAQNANQNNKTNKNNNDNKQELQLMELLQEINALKATVDRLERKVQKIIKMH